MYKHLLVPSNLVKIKNKYFAGKVKVLEKECLQKRKKFLFVFPLKAYEIDLHFILFFFGVYAYMRIQKVPLHSFFISTT